MMDVRLNSGQLSKVCFALFRSMHLNMFKCATSKQKLYYYDSLINDNLDPSKYFTLRKNLQEKDRGYQKPTLDWFVASENINLSPQLNRNRWISGIYDDINNCSNVKILSDQPSIPDSDEENKTTKYTTLPSLGLVKNKLTMAHMLNLCLEKKVSGTCRNCSSDINSFTHDELQLKFIDSQHEINPECSVKLKSYDIFHGFNMEIKCIITSKTQTRFSLEKIQISSESLKSCFLTALYQAGMQFNESTIHAVAKCIEIVNHPVRNCTLVANFNIEDINPMTGAVKEAINQGYFPLVDGINYSSFNAAEKSPLIDKIEQLVEVISRSCNPMLFLSAE